MPLVHEVPPLNGRRVRDTAFDSCPSKGLPRLPIFRLARLVFKFFDNKPINFARQSDHLPMVDLNRARTNACEDNF